MEVGFENGTVTLDHEKGLYYPGQMVSGKVKFRLERQVAVTAINIQFLGEARVSWAEHETQQRNGRSFETQVDYKALEQYFNLVQCLYGGQGPSQLNAGPHELPFQFQIPPSVPSSFRGEKGEVAYEIKVYLEYPGQARETLESYFTVVAPIDLNKEDPEIAKPLEMQFEEVYSCGCSCSPSPVTIDVTLPVSGFCPGQVVPVTVDVTNQANVEIKKVLLQIVTRTRYHSRQPVANYTTPEEVLASAQTKPVLSNMERHFTCDLVVPDMIAPNLNNCSIIDVGYFFKVTVKLSGCNDDLEDTSEIFIGQIPLQNFTDGQYVHPMAHSLPSGPIPEQIPRNTPLTNTQVNPVNAYPGFQPQNNQPGNAYPGYPNPGNAYPGCQPNNGNAYPGYQPNPGNTYPGFPPQNNQPYPGNAYPGFQPQPSVIPTAPALDTGYPNSGINNPNNGIGFRVDVPVSNQPPGPGYPMHNM